MNISGTGSIEQMRLMNGSGGGQGQGGMKDILQGLSTEDQATLKESLSEMSLEERMTTVTQMKEVDASSLSSEEYTQTLLDLLDKENTDDAKNDSFSIYA